MKEGGKGTFGGLKKVNSSAGLSEQARKSYLKAIITVWATFAVCWLRLNDHSFHPSEKIWTQRVSVVSLREVLGGETFWEPLTHSLMNELQRDHTPRLLTVCVYWLLGKALACGSCQGFILLKLPKLLHPPWHLLLLCAHHRGEDTWIASAFLFRISRGEWWTPSILSPITSTTTPPLPSVLSHPKAPRRPRIWRLLSTATTSAACTTSRASKVRKGPLATASGTTRRLQIPTCGSTGRASTRPLHTCTATTRRSSRPPTARSGSS